MALLSVLTITSPTSHTPLSPCNDIAVKYIAVPIPVDFASTEILKMRQRATVAISDLSLYVTICREN